MRKIKFRGVHNGKFVFGDLLQRGGNCFISEQTYDNPIKMWRVYPESVAQFIGVDETGTEIYEGDAYSGTLTSQ